MDSAPEGDKPVGEMHIPIMRPVVKDWGVKSPPHLRESVGKDRCEICGSYGLKPGSAWRGDGVCYLHSAPVKESFVCADYNPVG